MIQRDLLEHLLDIKERLATLEASANAIQAGLDAHREESNQNGVRIGKLEEDVNKAKGSVRALQWIVGIVGGVLVILKAVLH